ncbi:MAG: DNA polymerase III subunit delta [Pirellulaceae bacterium]|nr:DNA polymerase III subunit delta [Pirellulaceae bacterium]
MAEVLHVFELLDGPPIKKLGGSIALYGSDWFLRNRALDALLKHFKVSDHAVRRRDGEQTSWHDVHDDLATRSLFDEGGPRLTVVQSADAFVKHHREALEQWVEKSVADATLVLELDSLPGNTRLYKQLQKHGTLVQCSAPLKKGSRDTPDDSAIQKWLIKWGKKHHAVTLSVKQANVMVDRIGAEFGLIDSELAKVALFADSNGIVNDDIVHEIVGGWRTKTAWEIADSIAEGKIGVALEQLDGLIASGQNAIGLSAQLSWYFRRFGVAAHLIEQSERMGVKPVIATSLERAGFNRYTAQDAERRLRRIGRERARQMLAWLRELDIKLKSSHSQEDRSRIALEEFVMRLA